jgi:hypothetical protein
MTISGERYNLFQGVYDNVVIVLKGNGHSSDNTCQGAGLPLPKASKLYI